MNFKHCEYFFATEFCTLNELFSIIIYSTLLTNIATFRFNVCAYHELSFSQIRFVKELQSKKMSKIAEKIKYNFFS